MGELEKITEIMRGKSADFRGDYFIPACWNSYGYKNFKETSKRNGEISVNPYDFFCNTVETEILSQNDSSNDEKDAPLIYSVLPRSFTAWNHTGEKIEKGSFIKLILLLPLLKSYGITVIYLLPICSHGKMNMKGELGSPYAIRDFYELDSDLHEPLVGEFSKEMLHSEFKAFIEACHKLNIKVMLDFAFRTVSRDNVLIESHPDWFYWIKAENDGNFQPPLVGDGKKQFSVTRKNISLLYESDNTKKYLKAFTLPPNELDNEKWQKAVSEGDNTAEGIKKLFNIITVPGFSDVVNDVQPPWTDVTYLKYYFDVPKETQKYINKDQPPYIMQDGASLNIAHGEEKNEELFSYISNVLPFYHKTYGLDGARIDMAHALPPELNSMIIDKIRKADPEFLLWSEEFNPLESGQAKHDCFNFISGFIYATYKKANYTKFNAELLLKNMLKSEIPIAAAIETPDTPRSAYIYKNDDYVMMLYTINSFLPNAYPMLNSANELLEVQPMNLGLDNTEEGRFVLEKTDPMYGKLAFFDNYVLHWKNKNERFTKLLKDIKEIRRNNKKILESVYNFVPQDEFMQNKKLTPLLYLNKEENEGLMIITNRSSKERARASLDVLFPQKIKKDEAVVIYDKNGFCEEILENRKTLSLMPCETKIISVHQ